MVSPAEGPAQASPLRHPRFSPSVIPVSPPLSSPFLPLCHPGLDPGSRAFAVVGAASNAARPLRPPPSHAASHPLPLERAGVRGVVIPSTARNLAVAFELCFLCHPRPDRGSSVVVFVFCLRTRAISWRHLRAPAGVAAPQSRTLFGRRGLFERSAYPEQREGTLNQQPTAWKSRFLPSTGSGQARDPSLRSGQARNDN